MTLLDQVKGQVDAQAEEQEVVEDLDIENVKIGKFSPELAGVFKQYPQLQSLAFSECGLTTLEGFPIIPSLENLILENNQLDGSALKFIADNLKDLQCLSLAENKIKTFEELEVLKSLKHLQQLDLSENPVASLQGYHEKVFQLIPSLKVLDNKDQAGEEIQYSGVFRYLQQEEELSDEEQEQSDYDEDEDESEEESPKPVKKGKK